LAVASDIVSKVTTPPKSMLPVIGAAVSDGAMELVMSNTATTVMRKRLMLMRTLVVSRICPERRLFGETRSKFRVKS
jgi:hypothetical protein